MGQSGSQREGGREQWEEDEKEDSVVQRVGRGAGVCNLCTRGNCEGVSVTLPEQVEG